MNVTRAQGSAKMLFHIDGAITCIMSGGWQPSQANACTVHVATPALFAICSRAVQYLCVFFMLLIREVGGGTGS